MSLLDLVSSEVPTLPSRPPCPLMERSRVLYAVIEWSPRPPETITIGSPVAPAGALDFFAYLARMASEEPGAPKR